MNYNHLQNFLRCGFLFKDSTPWENIYEVLPGHYYEINLENIKIEKKRYFNILDYISINIQIFFLIHYYFEKRIHPQICQL